MPKLGDNWENSIIVDSEQFRMQFHLLASYFRDWQLQDSLNAFGLILTSKFEEEMMKNTFWIIFFHLRTILTDFQLIFIDAEIWEQRKYF